MNDTNLFCKVKAKLQYKDYKGYFYYKCKKQQGLNTFTAITDKMFCMSNITSSNCDLEIDYDVNEFSCVLKNDKGEEYELIDDFINFNSYIVSSEIIDENIHDYENSCLKYYNFKECAGVKLKVTLKLKNIIEYNFINVENEKGANAFWNVFLPKYADILKIEIVDIIK